jgi:uncharacterized protein
VTIYLDASALVAMFTNDHWTERTVQFLQTGAGPVIVSDFAAAEFSAVIARQARINQITPEAARALFTSFDAWVLQTRRRERVRSTDVAVAESVLRRIEIAFRAPDAIHLAIAQRLDAMLMTFDSQMAAAARMLGIPVAPA